MAGLQVHSATVWFGVATTPGTFLNLRAGDAMQVRRTQIQLHYLDPTSPPTAQ